ncbi:MAG: signal recognition particle-docking protein FtsY, partial [Opitutales bacterium]
DLRAQFAAAADELSRRNEELEAALEAGELAREERLARLEQDREARRQAAEEAREAARAEAEAEKDDTGDRRPGD